MHSKHIDLARATTAACYRDEPQHDRKISALWWLIPTALFWVAAFSMATIIVAALGHFAGMAARSW